MILIRDELLHPMLAHFPIVMFTLAFVVKSLEIVTSYKLKAFSEKLSFVSKSLIFTAPLFYLLTIYLGDIATDAIKNEFCELSLISKHEELGYYALYFFIGALLFESLGEVFKKRKLVCNFAVLISLIFSNYFIFKTAHSGAEMVYEKGAAVKVAPKCN
jgi:uncharacterized membrane protein